MKCYATTDSGLVPNILPDKRDFLLKTKSHARILCYKLHFKRLYLHKTHQRKLGELGGCQSLLLTIYISITRQILSELSGQPIQWIPRAPIRRRNIQQQLQEYNLNKNSNAPDLRLLIWVMKFKNIHFVTSSILV